MDYIIRSDIDCIVTQEDLITLTNDNTYSQVPDEVKIADILIYVNSLIDDSLRGRYSLPLPNVPPVIKEIAKQIARYKLYELRQGITETMRGDLSTNLDLLKEYSIGGSKVITNNSNESITPVTVITNKQNKHKNNRISWL